MNLEGWPAIPVGMTLLIATVLLTVWWRQQTYRWVLVVMLVAIAAPALSYWSGQAFQVPDYRAGCDGLCTGYRGAPIATYRSTGADYLFRPIGFALNTLAYAVIGLGWSAIVHSLLRGIGASGRRALLKQAAAAFVLFVAPVAFAPWYLPAPEARVRGDSLRVAINAGREVYMYDQSAPSAVLHVALADVRPRLDGEAGMRVCMRTYTFFYLPTGYLYLDMTPEGVHSNGGGFIPLDGSCWQPEEEIS